MSTSSSPPTDEATRRGAFTSRRVFIFAAIGSAVGLGNIWRFPYVAYDNGGGAFMIPYLVALLTAGIPFLFLDYAIGHRNRGSAPLSFARIRRGAEGLGWWQVGICFVIAVYYAAVIAWAGSYVYFSVTKAWGDDPAGFFSGEFLNVADVTGGLSVDFVPGVLIPLLVVWAVTIAVLAMGVQKGVGATAAIFIPVLVVVFGILVVQALLLPGAAAGLDQFFTPDWGALTDVTVWAAAYGQIFFSLSIGFGIMITYSSYVDRKTDMTGSGAVVGFANSSFELLAGIGVFAVLGFMAQASNQAVGDVLMEGGVGLAFIAFPAIISQAPAGSLLGVLFFVSLVLAGLTSLISIMEVVVAAVREKFEMSRLAAVFTVMLPASLVSVVLFSTTTGLPVLDVVDNFINSFGILLVAVVSMLAVAWVFRMLPQLQGHLNIHGSIPLGGWWPAFIGVITPVALVTVLALSLIENLETPYGDYPGWLLGVFGWGTAGGVIVFGFLASLKGWRPDTPLTVPAADPETGKEVRR